MSDQDKSVAEETKPVTTQPKSSEKDEELLLNLRVKVYRLADKEWKERGVGEAQISKNSETGKLRVLMRREKTLKLCLNHIIHPQMKLLEHKNSDKTWMWQCPADYSEETPTEEFFAMKFLTVDDALKWKETWETGKKFESTVVEKKDEEEVKEEKKEEVKEEKKEEVKEDEKKE